jgi:hypothetical protein
MLSRFDDYPIHQTPEPLAHPATSDRNVYDRYWVNGYAPDGEFYFGAGMAVYPHRHVLDGAFSVVRDGVQHAFFASRRAPAERGETEVGPLRIEVVEPMRRMRVTLAPNETGIECELEFTARTACIEEGRQRMVVEGRPVMDSTRFAQFGRWAGRIAAGGQTIAVDGARVLGTKDRSWGVRPVGEPEAGAPPLALPQIFFLWAPIHWEDHCTHFLVFEDADGRRWHEEAMVVPAYASPADLPGVEEPGIEHAAGLDHRIAWEPGTRRARSAELTLVARSGARRVIQLEPLLRFQMKGLGYTHPEWIHGAWKGDLAIGAESWRTDDLDPLAFANLHVQQVVRARSDGREGVGVLEQLAIGPHAPSGLQGFLDA